MRKLLVGLALVSMAAPGWSALPVGAKAPDFTATGAFKGKPISVHLAAKLKQGPVVLYFFPKANTGTCDLEAHLFSEKVDDFAALGATVIGMSADNQAVLEDFSTLKCGGKFPVATANARIRKAYDVVLAQKPEWATRTSYVIAPNGKIVMEYTDLKDAAAHVDRTFAAVKALKGK
jgi:peroxiredoxin Q/BCP